MSYSYNKRSTEELEQIAEIIFNRYAHRCSGCYIDVEGILEDCGLRILLRRGELRKYVMGYVASNPQYIILDEIQTSNLERYRFVVAEELCHVILEYDILSDGFRPQDAEPHNLTPEQHALIEKDAQYLSLALLFRRKDFIDKFNYYLNNHPPEFADDRGRILRYCGEKLEQEFQVWSLQVAYRARDIGLITETECQMNFSNRLAM